ncbi:Peroxin 13, N-terminal region-domain-containing protein [Lipomyces oligophaga]|uniref:Peroxin 13, N-terminal region-domain-containing protein n=1 Tax=Lipomyces oligophaga TaxID=45792 RepID=UPI0034CD1AA5
MLEAVIGAVGGFAQMLESTYMATHSSFFAMIGVAEQMAMLRKSVIGSASVGLLAIWKVFVRLWRKLTGRASSAPSGSKDRFSVGEFERFKSGNSSGAVPPSQSTPKVSVWPLLVFLGAVFGGPYLMSKLIKSMAASQQESDMHLSSYDNAMLRAGNVPEDLAQSGSGGVSGASGVATGNDLIIDPSKLEFCRALFDFEPENEAIELRLKKGEIVAILSKDFSEAGISDGSPTWWRGRLRSGKMGFFPSNYVEVIKRRTDTGGKVE